MTEATTVIKERPILFRGDMVRAILDGHKDVTRRPVKQAIFPCGTHADAVYPARESGWIAWQGGWTPGPELEEFTKQRYAHGFQCRYGQPGDHLWVRETWAPAIIDGESGYLYGESYRSLLDNKPTEEYKEIKWKPSIHMPRAASRITLAITDIRVERLHEITEDDARREGVEPWQSPKITMYKMAFLELWDQMHSKSEFASVFNPFVWRIEFTRATP